MSIVYTKGASHNAGRSKFLLVFLCFSCQSFTPKIEPKDPPRIFVEAEGFAWPVQGPVISPFGIRSGKLHRGIDIKVDKGTAVTATKKGTIIFAGSKRGYGRTVVIDHGTHQSLYAHCAKLQVKKNQQVRKGQVIALAGSSGNAKGTHLHFEVRTGNQVAIDPLEVLSESRYLTSK